MKSIKYFFISIFILVLIYLISDFLKHEYALSRTYNLFFKLRTFIFIICGIFVIYISFEKKVFHLFLKLYGAFWAIYIVLKAFEHIPWISLYLGRNSAGYYAKTFQLFSITPFIIFSCAYWLISKVLSLQKKK